jgi:hypothetical protein
VFFQVEPRGMMRRTLQPNERDPECPNQIRLNGQRLRNAISDRKGPTFPPPVVEGQWAKFACCRRLQSTPFLTVVCEAVRVNGQLCWGFLEVHTRDKIPVDLGLSPADTLNLK